MAITVRLCHLLESACVYYYIFVLGLELEVIMGMGWMLAVLYFVYVLGRTVYYSYPSYVMLCLLQLRRFQMIEIKKKKKKKRRKGNE